MAYVFFSNAFFQHIAHTVYVLQIISENTDESRNESESDSDDDTVLGDTHLSESSDESLESEDNIDEVESQDGDNDNVEQLFSVT